jgi:hypothetical protein
MISHRPVRWVLYGAALSLLGACAGTTPPAGSPTAEPAQGPTAPQAGAGQGSSPGAGAPGESAAAGTSPQSAPVAGSEESVPASPLEKPSRPVRQILETKDTVFFLSFEDSDPGKNAEASCAKTSAEDPQKNASCLAKARQPFEGLGYRFTRSPKDETLFTILRRQGNSLSVLHKFRFTYGKESEAAAVIKLEGKDEGPVKWEKLPPELKLEVPNDYTIVVQDPKHGRLVYAAKVGIPGE